MKSNLLHINLEKSCYVHFKPINRKEKGPDELQTGKNKKLPKNCKESIKTNFISLCGTPLKEVTETKFLGVTIDNKLSWESHCHNLHKKLKSATGMLARIRHNIPQENYKSLYFALFESHVSYCITVFGNANKQHYEKLFTVQKHCIRILFGDYKAYLNKFKTCARTRAIGEQKLGHDFYIREHTKPLFHKEEIMCFNNLYNYHLCLETLKILQSRQPSCLYECFNISTRNSENYLLTRPGQSAYLQQCNKIWNHLVKIIAKNEIIPSIKLSQFKRNLRTILLKVQNLFDNIEWYPENTAIETVNKVAL